MPGRQRLPREWGVEGQTLRQRDLGIVHPPHGEVEAVEARRVLHERGQSDRMRLFPAVGELKLGRQLANRGLEIEETVFDGVKHGEGREALGDGPDAEQVVRGHVDPGGDIRLANAAGPDGPVLVHQRDRCAGDRALVEDLLDFRPDVLNLDCQELRVLIGVVRFLGRRGERQRGREHQRDGTNASHEAAFPEALEARCSGATAHPSTPYAGRPEIRLGAGVAGFLAPPLDLTPLHAGD